MSVLGNVSYGLVSLAVCASLVGCAGMKGEPLSNRENASLLAEKDKEIERLSTEIASMESSLLTEKAARVTLEDKVADR